ncbi:phosphoribosyl-AMP cyclohydrolase [Microbacterium panaciterrae]|uniref:Phosphoribosyl-AMP cyclohydrolase n=1 Tax=Microbacterium panaciterrae TaxID=985759 RepID=A0ABP8P6D9_9MICO
MTDDRIEAELRLVTWNEAGLVPVIVQQWDTLEVLMMAWADKEALRRSLTTGRATYWSRSRQQYWRKGDTSGHVQHVRGARLDCDGDTVLLFVDQIGAACHTGTRTCFDGVDLDPILPGDEAQTASSEQAQG